MPLSFCLSMDFREKGYWHCFTDFTNMGWLCLGRKLYSCVLSQKFKDCVVSGICFVYAISQKITAVFFSFQVVTWSEACGPALVRVLIFINLPTPKKMIIYFKESFSKDWTQSTYLLSIASSLCVIHFNNNNNNNNNNGLISVHPWYGSSPDIKVKYGN